MADAAALLVRRCTLQATNVPFLGRGKQELNLPDLIGRVFLEAKADLATAMLRRMTRLAAPGGTVSSVMPQNWLFLGTYKKPREQLLQHTTLNLIGALGPRAFETITGEVVNTVLVALTVAAPGDSACIPIRPKSTASPPRRGPGSARPQGCRSATMTVSYAYPPWPTNALWQNASAPTSPLPPCWT